MWTEDQMQAYWNMMGVSMTAPTAIQMALRLPNEAVILTPFSGAIMLGLVTWVVWMTIRNQRHDERPPQD